jgi:hypothetical protein
MIVYVLIIIVHAVGYFIMRVVPLKSLPMANISCKTNRNGVYAFNSFVHLGRTEVWLHACLRPALG